MKEETSKVFIDLIAVSHNSQGLGVGHKLVDAVVSKIRTSKDLYVTTQQNNIQVCHFYKKCGFKIADKQYLYIRF